jgi:hypothetical protein
VALDISEPTHKFKLVGVISGYKNENLPLNVNGRPAINASVATNTGIIVVIPTFCVPVLFNDGDHPFNKK